MESAAFNLKKIEVLEENFPDENAYKACIDKQYSWQCGFAFKIKQLNPAAKGINIDISYKMHPIDDPEKSILFLKTRSCFSAEGTLDAVAKLNLLYQLIAITLWNYQGVYAAKTEGRKYSSELPPEATFNQFEEKFKLQIANEWK